MRLGWDGWRARAQKSAREDSPRKLDRRAQKDRAEILRLIERLRGNRQRLATSSDPRHEKAKAVIDATLSEQMSRLGGGGESPASPRSPLARRAGSSIEGARALTQQPSDSPRGGGAVGVLQRLEERLARIEERLGEAASRTARSKAPAAADADYTFEGIIQGDLLSDVLQMISSNTMTGVFTIKGELLSHAIHVSEGQIVHAEGAGMSGESAFFAAFATTNGRYSFRQTADITTQKTIDGNTQFLILEALRRIDEVGSDGKEGGGG
jgi:hypothetical protein